MEYLCRRGRYSASDARSIPISSNKSMIGHTLSAAGAVESVISPADAGTSAPAADHQLRRARPGDSVRRGAERRARRARDAYPLQLVRLRRAERLARHRRGATLMADTNAARPGHRRRARARLRDRALLAAGRARRDLHVSLGSGGGRRAGEGADRRASGAGLRGASGRPRRQGRGRRLVDDAR